MSLVVDKVCCVFVCVCLSDGRSVSMSAVQCIEAHNKQAGSPGRERQITDEPRQVKAGYKANRIDAHV